MFFRCVRCVWDWCCAAVLDVSDAGRWVGIVSNVAVASLRSVLMSFILWEYSKDIF